MKNSFLDYQLMYLIMTELYEEKPDEKVALFLSDANPYTRDVPSSADCSIYDGYKRLYDCEPTHEDFSYNVVVKFLKGMNYYRGVFELFSSLSREEYVKSCQNAIGVHADLLKKHREN